jgi:HK97 gp10 family phage protein
MSGFELEGFDQITSRLLAMGEEGKVIEEKAVKEGAKIMRDRIEEAIPESYRNADHSKDHIIIGEMKNGVIPIGPDQKHYYLRFPEFGTSKQPAQGFMSRAFNDSKDDAQSEIASVVRRVLGI